MTNEKNNDLVNLSGAYALNALDPAEKEAFEAFIAESPETRYEVTELLDTAVVLGLAVDPIEPSTDLRASLMAKIAQTPQLAPLASTTPVVQAGPAPLPTVSDTEIAPAAEPVVTASSFEPTATDRKTNARWFTRPAAVLASMAAAVALIAGGVVVSNTVAENQVNQAQADKLALIMSAADVQQVSADVAGGGSATVAWSIARASSVVMVDGVAALPSDKVYELWYIDKDGARPAGTFSVDSSGEDAWRVLDGKMKTGDTIGVTVEPAGGSDTPTTDPILAVTTV